MRWWQICILLGIFVVLAHDVPGTPRLEPDCAVQQIGLVCVGMAEACPLAVSVPGQSPAPAAPLQELQ